MNDGDESSFPCSFLAAMVTLARHFSRCLIHSGLCSTENGEYEWDLPL
jgi:hypothetical protein